MRIRAVRYLLPSESVRIRAVRYLLPSESVRGLDSTERGRQSPNIYRVVIGPRGNPMSLRSQRRLLAVAIIGWVVWIPAFVGSMMMEVSGHHILAQYAALAVAVTFTICWVIVATIAPVIAANRALLATRPRCGSRCEGCATVSILPQRQHHQSVSN